MRLPLRLFLIAVLIVPAMHIHAQAIKGSAIQGVNAGDRAGCSVSMPDAQTLAVGAYFFDGNATDAGHVRVYMWNGASWLLKGNPITGEGANDRCGNAVSMPDANTLAVGALFNDGIGTDAGHVRIFTWSGANWIQKGADIDGESDSSHSGNAISMPDAQTIAIGAYANNGINGKASGRVRVFTWNGNSWIQKGTDIDGEAAGDFSGNAVSMPDANTVAVGAIQHDGAGENSGKVQVWMWNGNNWVQKGEDVDGLAAGDMSGWSVHMPDANTLAIGAPYHDSTGTDAGVVRVMEWNGTSWVQKGDRVYGKSAGDRMGWTVRMPVADVLAVGASGADAGGLDAGQVTLFEWNGNGWVQKGSDINGTTAGDRSGWSISMPDRNNIAIGAPFHATHGTEAGHARVYSFTSSSVQAKHMEPHVRVYPNPGNGTVTLFFDERFDTTNVVLRNMSGKEVGRYAINECCQVQLPLMLTPGMYIAEIHTKEHLHIAKLMVY